MASARDAEVLREERKVVTALFADLVGSTAIGSRFDPEDAREIISGAIALAIDAIERYGGTVKDLAGDGVLALFGAPVSHEDDVERAILAGLAIADAMNGYAETVARDWGHEGLGVRIGIDTGLAVLGPVGAGRRVEYGAVGDVLNTAARLQTAARPGAVLVGASARSEATGLFEWEPPSTLSLKGKDDPVVASVAVKPKRTDARGLRRWDAPLVGRTAELVEIDEALTDLTGGVGSAVLVVGEPGIGKSRFVAEARRRALSGRYGSPITWLEGRCLSWAEGVPYGLFRHLLAGWLGVSADDPTDRIRSALGSAGRSLGVFDPGVVELLGRVLSAGARLTEAPGGAGDAESVRERVFDAIEATLLALAATRPLAVSLEDIHWADPTSLALTERLLSAVQRAPLLVLMTRRPDVEHPSQGTDDSADERPGRSARTIVLGPLTDDESAQLFRSLVGDEGVSDGTRSRILDTTEGNPFFLEEQIRSLQESAEMGLGHDLRSAPTAPVDLPRTIERVLLARIDRLRSADKDVLVAASVLGREFEPALLDGLIDDGSDVTPALDRLREVDLVRAERHGSDQRFRFKHALIQEAAYRSLLKRRRRELHGRAAAAIEAAYEVRIDQVAGALGHHLQNAGEPERAVPHLMLAGDRAREAFANEEALAWYDRAAEAVAAIPESSDLAELRNVGSDVQARRGDVLSLGTRYREAREAYRRGLELVSAADAVKAARIRTSVALLEISDHRYQEGLAELQAAEEMLGVSEESAPTDPEPLAAWLDIQDARMTAYYWLDDLEGYGRLIERVRPIVENEGAPERRAEFFETLLTYCLRRDRYLVSEETLDYARSNLAAAAEVGDASQIAWARFNLGFTLVWTGRLEEAVVLLDESLSEAERMGDVTLRSRALTYRMVLDRRRGDASSVERAIGTVIAAAREASLPEYEAMAIANRSWVHFRAGDVDEAEADTRRAIELWRSLPVRYPFEWMALWPLLHIELERGRIAEAITCALDMLADHQQPLPPDLASRLKGAIAAWDGGTTERVKEELSNAVPLALELAYL